MSHLSTALLVAALAAPGPLSPSEARAASPGELDALVAAFTARTGARLVFTRDEVPADAGFDVMLELAGARRIAAARLALDEAAKYPRGYLGAMGLETIGLYEGLASRKGDGYRPWVKRLGGYRYFGQWNGEDTIVAAYYSDEQLPLTLHHEVFHHVDATVQGTRDSSHSAADDVRFAAAIAGDELISERHPTLRNRQAIAALVRYFVPRTQTALIGSYRYYRDNWEVHGHTPELRVIQQIGDVGDASFRYRYHTQDGAFFFRDRYTDAEGVMGFVSDDVKLSSTSTHTIEAKLGMLGSAFELEGKWGNTRFEAMLQYVVQYNRFGNAIVAHVGLTVPFDY